MTTSLISAGFIALAVTAICAGLAYIAGLKTGRAAGNAEIEAQGQTIDHLTTTATNLALAYNDLQDHDQRTLRRRLLEDTDLRTLTIVTDTLETAAKTFRAIGGDKPADATLKQRAELQQIVLRMSRATDDIQPDTLLVEWLNEHAAFSADFNLATLTFDLVTEEAGFYGHLREVLTRAATQQQDRENEVAA